VSHVTVYITTPAQARLFADFIVPFVEASYAEGLKTRPFESSAYDIQGEPPANLVPDVDKAFANAEPEPAPVKRTRKKTAEAPAPAPAPEPENVDETPAGPDLPMFDDPFADEAPAAAPATRDDVKAAMQRYVSAFSMDALARNAARLLGAPRQSEIPEDSAAFAEVVARIEDAIASGNEAGLA
jgi:hypothetical protein